MSVEHQAVLTYVESVTMVLFWQGRKVPSFNLMLSNYNELHSFDLSAFQEFKDSFIIHAFMLIVGEEVFILLLGQLHLFILFLLLLDLVMVNVDEGLLQPPIITSVYPQITHIILKIDSFWIIVIGKCLILILFLKIWLVKYKFILIGVPRLPYFQYFCHLIDQPVSHLGEDF